jgi:eukaryotic-like serine/threonine-protein kinase
MHVASGTRLGPYEILSRIGSGGMGEVWRARDSRIARDVAIKVLPQSFAAGEDRLRRFEQEARAAGALNHAGLVTIFDVGNLEGSPYIVMELLEGTTLRELLGDATPAALPLRKAVDYATQMALALAVAHEKGVVHRDLKPENLFVTRDGRLKILDFGLAKLAAPDTASAESQTQQKQTSPGTVLGTAGYMSPEQVRGREVDHRTDVFSLGIILYEMLAGSHPFRRDSTVETMNAILTEDVAQLSASGQHVPVAIERITQRCLEKNPAERFQSARDVAFALEAMSSPSTPRLSGVQDPPRHHRLLRRAVLGIAAVALIIGAAIGGRSLRREAGQPEVRELTSRNGTVRAARFAPDGQTVVYGAAWDGAPLKLFQRRLDGRDSVPLELPDGDVLAISTKGELAISLGRNFRNWLNTGQLAKAALLGGSFRKVLDGVSWADWHPTAADLLIVRRIADEDRIEYPIGKVIYRTSGFISYPRFSADGTRVAFLDHPIYGDNRGNVSVVTLDGEKRDLVRDWSALEGLAWSPKGGEIWFSGTEVSGAFAIHAVRMRGAPRVVWRTPGDLILHDIDAQGRVLVAHGMIGNNIRGLARGEKNERDLSFGGWAPVRAISRDGKQALVASVSGDSSRYYDLFVRPLDGGAPVRVGEGEAKGFSSDGKWAMGLLFTTPPRLMLYATEAEVSRVVDTQGINVADAEWFPDGRRLLLVTTPAPGKVEYLVQEIDSGRRTPLHLRNAPLGQPLVSPDQLKVALTDRAVDTPSRVYSLEGALLAELPGQYFAIAWTADSNALYVYDPDELPARVQRWELATGAFKSWKTVAPPDVAGLRAPIQIRMNPDGDAYAYDIPKMLTDLFIVDGLR